MYGRIGSLMVLPENRQALMEALTAGSADMPGCMAYVVGADAHDESLVWVSEVWETEAAHRASLELPQVRDAISRARPVLVGFGESHETAVVALR